MNLHDTSENRAYNVSESWRTFARILKLQNAWSFPKLAKLSTIGLKVRFSNNVLEFTVTRHTFRNSWNTSSSFASLRPPVHREKQFRITWRMQKFSIKKKIFRGKFSFLLKIFVFVVLYEIVSPYAQATSNSQNYYLLLNNSWKCDGL